MRRADRRGADPWVSETVSPAERRVCDAEYVTDLYHRYPLGMRFRLPFRICFRFIAAAAGWRCWIRLAIDPGRLSGGLIAADNGGYADVYNSYNAGFVNGGEGDALVLV